MTGLAPLDKRTLVTDFEPSRLKRWTHPENYFGEVWPEFYTAGVGRSRDSDALEESNFTAMLAALGGENGDTIRVVRESHWAVGWVEWIAISQDDGEALKIANEIREALDDYPVIDEEAYSELEYERAADFWEGLSPRDKVQEAIEARKRFHWLSKTPVWRFGRMSYHDLGNDGSEIAEYLCETFRTAC